MPPSRRISNRNSVVSQEPVAVLSESLPSVVVNQAQPRGNGFWIFLSVIAIGAMFIFRSGFMPDPNPSPKPDDQHQVDPQPKPDDQKPQPKPEPQPVKKFEGKAIFLSPRTAMDAGSLDVVNSAAKYRSEVGREKFDYLDLESEKDKSENVVRLVDMAKGLGKTPPCVLWIPSTGKTAAFDWPKSFDEFKQQAVK